MFRRVINVGDVFEVRHADKYMPAVNTFRREPDDPNPLFECEMVRVTHIKCSVPSEKWTPYTFGAEPAWFENRGLAIG